MSTIIIEGNPTFKKVVPKGESFINVSEFFCDTIQGENFVGWPAAFLRVQSCSMACFWCFHENTEITTVHNSPKKIKQIEKGEVLLTLDEKHNIVETTVKELVHNRVNINELIGVRFSSTNIYTTKNHPFYVRNRGWVEAGSLKSGDIILGPTSTQIVSYRKSKYNNQFNEDFLSKRIETQKLLRQKGLIKPYVRTEENKKTLSDIRKKNNPMRNPEVARRNFESHNFPISSLEKQFQQVFEELNFDILYIGNGEQCKAIGDLESRYRFPDFIVRDTQKIIEVYHTEYHYTVTGTTNRAPRGVEWQSLTREHYKKFDYEVLFLTERDLEDKVKLREKLFNFVYNGDEILEIFTPSSKQRAALFGSSSVQEIDVYNLSCEPYNTYLLHENRHHKLVHNCDTQEVWRFGNPYTYSELFELMEKVDLPRKLKEGQHLVLTGGSPMLQQRKLVEFIELFIEKYGFKPFIEVENECTIEPDEDFIKLIDLWNNSPKLKNSGNSDFIRYQPELLKYLSSLPNSWFKFVVSKEEEWEEIQRDFLDKGLIKKSQVVLMPMGATREELFLNREIVIDLAIKYNVRYTTREHIVIWDKKTGI